MWEQQWQHVTRGRSVVAAVARSSLSMMNWAAVEEEEEEEEEQQSVLPLPEQLVCATAVVAAAAAALVVLVASVVVVFPKWICVVLLMRLSSGSTPSFPHQRGGEVPMIVVAVAVAVAVVVMVFLVNQGRVSWRQCYLMPLHRPRHVPTAVMMMMMIVVAVAVVCPAVVG